MTQSSDHIWQPLPDDGVPWFCRHKDHHWKERVEACALLKIGVWETLQPHGFLLPPVCQHHLNVAGELVP